METFTLDQMVLTTGIRGANRYTKVSFPVRYGSYTEIRTPEYEFQFNLNGEIRHMRGVSKSWPDPNEWFKRTVRNHWIYYSTVSYRSIDTYMGEFYLPFQADGGNTLLTVNTPVRKLLNECQQALRETLSLLEKELEKNRGLPGIAKKIITANKPNTLSVKAFGLNAISGGSVPVLPPDTRHADYDVIPLLISDGCVYNCGFCSVKTSREYSERTPQSIEEQIEKLREFYGEDIRNYNSVFLGQNDALNAGTNLICQSAQKAYGSFGFENSFMKKPTLHMFGSIHSFLNKKDDDFKAINHLPFYTYINIGIESFDQKTLDHLRKPVSASDAHEVFFKMIRINRAFPNIEVTSNFVLGEDLPDTHVKSFIRTTSEKMEKRYAKGGIYISPFLGTGPRGPLKKMFNTMKNRSKLPAYIYQILPL